MNGPGGKGWEGAGRGWGGMRKEWGGNGGGRGVGRGWGGMRKEWGGRDGEGEEWDEEGVGREREGWDEEGVGRMEEEEMDGYIDRWGRGGGREGVRKREAQTPFCWSPLYTFTHTYSPHHPISLTWCHRGHKRKGLPHGPGAAGPRCGVGGSTPRGERSSRHCLARWDTHAQSAGSTLPWAANK